MQHNRNKLAVRAVALTAMLVTAALVTACSSGSSSSGKSGSTDLVYFMIPNTTPTRYIQQDGPDFEKALKALDPKAKVEFVNAGGSSATQLTQAQTAIAAGAKALVVVAADPNTSAGLLSVAEAAKVPVIGYENPPIKGKLYAQVQFDPKNAGQVQAEYFAQQVTSGALGALPVTLARLYGNKGDTYTTQMLAGQAEFLDPLIQAGKIKVVCEDYVKDWAPDAAQAATEQCLTKTQNGVRAVLGFYDGITAGAIAALKGHDVTGKVGVYGGQNPELSGLQYMLTGDQQDEVIKAFPVEAEAAAKLAFGAIRKQTPPAGLVNGTTNNGTTDVPTALLKVEYIHLGDGTDVGALVQKAVDYGMFTWKQICTGPAASTATCKVKNS